MEAERGDGGIAREAELLDFRPLTERKSGKDPYYILASGLELRLENGRPAASEATSLYYRAFKRTLDITLSAAALIVLAPALLLVTVLVRATSPGPAIFAQWRVGKGGRPFRIYKFRTMRAEECDDTGLSATKEDDTRVTAIGRFLRSRSLDELPQLINVLIGDMSLIGPRPHVPGMFAAGQPYDQLISYYEMRHRIRPGLSGWAQVNGFRGPVNRQREAVARITHDIAYIQNMSTALDLKIIVRTALKEFTLGSGS